MARPDADLAGADLAVAAVNEGLKMRGYVGQLQVAAALNFAGDVSETSSAQCSAVLKAAILIGLESLPVDLE
jgi:hypothetical protein